MKALFEILISLKVMYCVYFLFIANFLTYDRIKKYNYKELDEYLRISK